MSISEPKMERMRLDELARAAYNPRRISPEALAGLEASLQRFGLVQPIIVNVHDGRKTVVGGHQRLTVLEARGVEETSVLVVDLPPVRGLKRKGITALRFVVADDSSTERGVVRQILGSLGHDVVGMAKNGAEAVEMTRLKKPDAVMLDVGMPVMTGDVAAALIASKGLARYIFVASSLATISSVLARVHAAGAHAIGKPYVREQMRQAIEGVCGGKAPATGCA